jgi:pectinesterase
MQRCLLGLVAGLAVAIAACSGGGQTPKQDTGVTDVPAQTDTPADMTTGNDASANNDGAPDGGVEDAGPTDGPTVDCAPVPTGITPAGTAAQQAAGPMVASTATRPELSDQAAGDYTIRKALAQGYVINNGMAPDGGVGSVTYSLNDNWDPLTNGIGNPATFTPMFTVAADGSGTHTDFKSVFNEANVLATCSRVYIRVKPGTYREQVLVPSKTSAPPITVYSTESDASKTVIIANQSEVTAGSMSNSATLTVKAVRGFQMKNITVANDYVEDASITGGQSAVAMLVQSDQAQFENVRFLGNIGTLYVKSAQETIAARSYFRDCYVEGDQDFIVGRGTAVFDHTEVKVLSGRKATGVVIGYPSTLVFNRYGFLFDSCTFSAETGARGTAHARQWVEQSDTVATRGMAVGKMIVRNSTLGAHVGGAAPWSSTGARTSTPKAPDPDGGVPTLVYTSDDYFPAGVGPTPAEPFLGEYRNSGPGAHQ